MTLDEFVSAVVHANPLVLEQVHLYRQVAQDERIALSGWRPRLDLAASFGQFSREAPNTGQRRREFDSHQADLTLTQNLFAGFDTRNAVAQARARISAAAFRLYDTADNVALEAVQAYLKALNDQRQVELAAQNVESHQRILSQIRELSERGITRRSDLEQTEGRLARAQASLIAQQNNLEDALTQLHTLLGRYVAPAELSDPRSPDPIEDMTVSSLLDEALRAHPAIESARRNVEASKFDYERSKSTNLPTLDLALRKSFGDDIDGTPGTTDEGSIVLSLNYNLYRGGADIANQRKKASATQENKAFLDRVRRQVIDTLRLAMAADRALERQIPYLERHSRQSLETVELYREEYLLQKRDLIDLLDAENELNGALTSEAEARYDAIAARFRVYEGVGALFAGLGLAVDVEGDDFRLSQLRASGVDGASPVTDRDADGLPDERDQCVNSPPGAAVDEQGCASQPRVELGFEAVDLTFEAVDDSFATSIGIALEIPLSQLVSNDRYSPKDEPEIRAYTQAKHGAVTFDGEDKLIYTPAIGYVGADGFEYTIGDRRGRRATGSVRIEVTSGGAEVERLHFEYKKLVLTPQSEARLDRVVARLEERPQSRVQVLAYTDNVGSRQYNLRLSRRRAEAMRALLVARGIDAARITAKGMGENDPIADNATDEGRALNRRVELHMSSSSRN